MKKYIPHILIGLIVAALIVLFFTGKENSNRSLNERLSFRKRDKIPYGTYAAYESLKYMFPRALIVSERQEPGNWDSLSVYGENQALVIISPDFNADKYEMTNLVKFVENGNDVFLSAINLSDEATETLACEINSIEHLISYFSRVGETDTLTVSLYYPRFTDTVKYTYPGKQFDGYFSKLDTSTTTVLGHDEKGHPDFIHLRAGRGNFYVHLAPMAFTNYFLLHKENFDYYEKIFSLISPATTKVLWDEYYLNKQDRSKRDPKKKGWLSTLLNIENPAGKKPFAAAFWLLLGLLVLYVLMEMRRKQRYIPVVKKLQNDSLDFVKTIGRLYHDKGDHRNLCRKMSAYFLEHVRNRYKLATNTLDEDFVKSINIKTGVDEAEIRSITTFIKELDTVYSVSDEKLTAFHKQLESFYKKA